MQKQVILIYKFILGLLVFVFNIHKMLKLKTKKLLIKSVVIDIIKLQFIIKLIIR